MTTKEKDKKPTFDDIFGAIKPEDEFSKPTFTIIYGDVGCGKTYLASTCQKFGKTVLVNFENRISHIDETENLRIIPTSQGDFREDKACTYDQFINFLTFVQQNDIKFNNIILDTGDEMFIKFMSGMLKRGEIQDKYFSRPLIYDKLWEITKTIKDLGINIIMNLHQKEENLKTTFLIKDALKSRLNTNVDNIFYLKKTDENNRVLILKSSDELLTKLTVKPEKYESIPEQIENPTWEKVIEVIG